MLSLTEGNQPNRVPGVGTAHLTACARFPGGEGVTAVP